MHISDIFKPKPVGDRYKVPSTKGFISVPSQESELESFKVKQAIILEETLKTFKVDGTVKNVSSGPLVSRYEIELAPGVKVNKIVTLSDDLALALKTMSIRILAPIPGTSLVGVEIPNKHLQIVHIKEILESEQFVNSGKTLPIAIGKTTDGIPYVADLTKMPHMLVAGQTGSGKSCFINSIMASFLVSKTPDQLRLILIDPKRVELTPYENIPHLLTPVVTDPEKSVKALEWAVNEMERRYLLLSDKGVKNIDGYNQQSIITMSHIVIIIDEMADLILTAKKLIELPLVRLAQKGRSAGLHIITATQRPDRKVITGNLKANFTNRMCFKVSSQIDAKIVMDFSGAEKLVGCGDMLYKGTGEPTPVRLHGSYISDVDINTVIKEASSQFVKYAQIDL